MLTRRGFLLSVAALAGAALVTGVAELVAAVRAGLSGTLLRVLEPQKGRWVNDNNWGDQHFGPLPATAGIVQAVLAKNTKMYGPPSVHSVQLARSDDTTGNNADMRARVTYGCGGVNNSFDCDFFHGSQFALVCNSLDVKAVSFAPVGWHAYDPAQGSIALRASCSKGSVAQGSQPLTFTEPQAFLTEAGGAHPFQDFQVVDFVKSFTVHLTDDTGATNSNPATVTGVTIVIQNGGNILAVYDAQVCAGGRAIPLPGYATSVRLINTLAAPHVALPTVVWFLGL